MKWCINQLNISYRRTILFLTSLIYNNSWSYSKQTNSQAKKQVYMCLKKYYTCQTYTLDLQKTFDIAVVYVIWHISLGLFSCIHQNNIYSYSETSGGNIFAIITMLYIQRIGKVTDSSRHDAMLNSDFLLFVPFLTDFNLCWGNPYSCFHLPCWAEFKTWTVDSTRFTTYGFKPDRM